VQADSSTVVDPRPGLIAPRSEATRRQSSDTEISARILFSDSFAVAGTTAASSSTANRRNGLPYQLDRAKNRGDHEHHRRGDAYGQNVIQHSRPEKSGSEHSQVSTSIRATQLPDSSAKWT